MRAVALFFLCGGGQSMATRTRRDNRREKARKRFATLRQRRAKQSALYEALERRQRADHARLSAARRRSAATTGRTRTPVIERRRHEYVEIAAPSPTLIPQRAILASLAVAFVLPLIVAIAADLMPHHAPNAIVARIRAHRTVAQPRTVARAPVPRQVQPVNPARPQLAHSAPHFSSKAALAAINPPARPQGAHAIAPPQADVHLHTEPVVAHAPARPAAPRPSPIEQVALAPSRSAALPAHRRPALAWTLGPDGTWTALVRAPAGMHDANFAASTGQIISLERSPVDGEAAIVTIGWSRPVAVTISSGGDTANVDLPAPDDSAEAFAATARAIGPHLVNVGWTPLSATAAVADYKVYRSSSGGDDAQLVAELPPVKHAWHDVHVRSRSQYRYDVVAETQDGAVEANALPVSTPDDLPIAPSSVLAGKGMFLYFSSLSGDARSFRQYHPEAVIGEAQKAGIHVIELRMARGTCEMAQTDQARAWLDRLIDAAARANISLVAWTVPRRVTTQDLAQTVAAASYTTPAGNGFVGVALDLESGDRYMGYGLKASAGMVQYIKLVRAATGPHYLIVATVASPEMGNHTNADYPYAKIAAYADVLQPMEYWHYFDEASHHEYARREVAGASAAAVARTRALAGRDIPVDVAGQSVDLEGTGAPSGREIQWSLGGAKSAGGIGETFFDWAGTPPDAWAAIQAFDW